MKLIYKIQLFLLFILASSLWPVTLWSWSAPGLCLHPIERMALLQGKSKTRNTKSEIKKIKAALKKLEKQIDKKKDYLDDKKTKLENALKDDTAEPQVKKQDMVEVISQYMEGSYGDLSDLSTIELQDINGKDINGLDDNGDLFALPWWSHKGEHDDYFKSDGKIKESQFCREYASNQKACEGSIEDMENAYKKLFSNEEKKEKYEDYLEELEDEQYQRDAGLLDEDETEASGLCFECLDAVRELDKPTTGQITGNILSVLAGGALSYYAYKDGRKQGRELNDLRLNQGFDPINTSGLSWAGASLGLPFMSQGIAGLTGGNSQFGRTACNPNSSRAHSVYSPFSRGGGYLLVNGRLLKVGNPLASGNLQLGNLLASGGLQVGNPLGSLLASGGLQLGSPLGSLLASGGLQLGNPFGNLLASGNLQVGNPLGNLLASGGFQIQQQQAQIQAQIQARLQAQLQAQQAAQIQAQQAAQRDLINRRQVISSLTQELYKIQQQIQLVASGSLLGASTASLTTGVNIFNNNDGPNHNPVTNTGNTTGDDWTVIETR